MNKTDKNLHFRWSLHSWNVSFNVCRPRAKPFVHKLLRFPGWPQQSIKQNVGPCKCGAQCDLHRLRPVLVGLSGMLTCAPHVDGQHKGSDTISPLSTGGTIVGFSFGDSGVKTELFWVSGQDEIAICHCTIKVLALPALSSRMVTYGKSVCSEILKGIANPQQWYFLRFN